MFRKIPILIALILFQVSVFAAEPQGLREAMASHDKRNPASYQFKYALADLNGDGIKDAVVYLTGQEWCGSGGCTMRILKGTKSGFVFLSGTLRVYAPIMVLSTKTHGWKSLAITLRAGGMGVLKFNGKHYPLSPPDGHPASAAELQGAVALVSK